MRIAEIQGLRALAVLLVIAFHAKFLHGGFIGVDIFYVISGYLITGLLLRELDETGSISFRNFYVRRIKRLLPSSFLVLLSTGLFGFLLMPANMRADLGSLIAGIEVMHMIRKGQLGDVKDRVWSAANQFYSLAF